MCVERNVISLRKCQYLNLKVFDFKPAVLIICIRMAYKFYNFCELPIIL